MKVVFIWFGCFLLVSNSLAQNLSGTWQGMYEKTIFVQNPQKLLLDLEFTNDTIITGTTHLYYSNNYFEHYLIKGKFNKKDSSLKFSEDKVSSIRIEKLAQKCMGNYSMKLVKNDSIMRIEGIWKDKNGGILNCGKSKVFFEKRKHVIKYQKSRDSIKLNRLSSLQGIIKVQKEECDSIVLDVVDNGIVDNDIISIYVNDSLITKDLKLQAKNTSYLLKINKEQKLFKIKIVAETLGDIPPCTCILYVKTKTQKQQFDLASTFDSNGIIEMLIY